MRNVFSLVVGVSFALVLCSCVTVPTKQAEGNFEISVSPLADGEKPLYPSVYVDKKFIGHATAHKPILYLRRGRHTVRVELEGYETWEKTIVLLGEPSQQVLHVQLKKLPANHANSAN